MTWWLVTLLAVGQTSDDAQSEKDAAFAWYRLAPRGNIRLATPSENPRKSFVCAADGYESLRDRQETPQVDRWLGHSYLGAGALPYAIAAYRRGLALDPADAKLRAALDYARAQVQYPPTPELTATMRPETEVWPPWLALRRLGPAAFLLYLAGCLAATRWRMTRRRRWLAVALSAFAIVAVPAVGSLIEWRGQRRDAAMPVVVVAQPTELRTGNGLDYPPRLDAPLPRGCEARRLFVRGDWWQVELGGGVVGWLPRTGVLTIED